MELRCRLMVVYVGASALQNVFGRKFLTAAPHYSAHSIFRRGYCLILWRKPVMSFKMLSMQHAA